MMSGKRLMILVPALFVLVALSLGAAGCAPVPGGDTGDAAAGQALFTERCSGCHSTAQLKPVRFLIISNLGTLNSAMSGITLTPQEIADIRAFLATQ